MGSMYLEKLNSLYFIHCRLLHTGSFSPCSLSGCSNAWRNGYSPTLGTAIGPHLCTSLWASWHRQVGFKWQINWPLMPPERFCSLHWTLLAIVINGVWINSVLLPYNSEGESIEGAGPLPLVKLPALCCCSLIERECRARVGGREGGREGVFPAYFPCAPTPLPWL